MSEMEDLYQEIILDHNKRPRNHRVLFGSKEHWFYNREEVDAFREAEVKKGLQLVVADAAAKPDPRRPGAKP